MKDKKFQYENLNLLKCVCMFLIVLWHCIIHGNVLGNIENPYLNIIINMILFLIIVHVNCFVMITGFFQHKSKVKIKKIIEYYIQVVFYCLIIYLIDSLIMKNKISMELILYNISPFAIKKYWFMYCYLMLYIFSDYLNIIIQKISKSSFEKGLLLMYIIFSIFPFIFFEKVVENNGFTTIHFVFLYFIGAYLNMYPLKEQIGKTNYMKKVLLVFLGCFAINFITNYITDAYYYSEIKSTIAYNISSKLIITKYSYARPLVILQSIAFFEIFNNLNVSFKFSKFTKYLLGIYLVSENDFIRPHLYKYLTPINSFSFVIKLIIYAELIFTICFVIEFLRKKIFLLFEKRIS